MRIRFGGQDLDDEMTIKDLVNYLQVNNQYVTFSNYNPEDIKVGLLAQDILDDC